MRRVCVIFGTRPEAIKMAPVIKELKRYSHILETWVVVTAQHREMLDEMLDQVLNVFGLTVDEDLNLMLPDRAA